MVTNTISKWFYQFNKDIYHFLLYYVGTGDIEDLVQEVFIRAIKSFDSYQGNASPKTWLFSIARHVAIDEIRKRKRSRINVINDYNQLDIKDEKNPETILQLTEDNKKLYNAIQSLKSNYREVIILRAIKELSVLETAEVLHWNENKVRISYHRALKALKKKREEIQDERE
jgi:RNA polymerase sigma-70 factor, ECF subfamily